MILLKFVRSYLVPGEVFQSIVVGGGYGTGREIVQYFTNYGPHGGLLGIFVAFAMFALVLCFTFEIARQFKAFDYRSFFKILLGENWFLYEIVGMCMLLLTFAVLISAASGVLSDGFGLPAWMGMAVVFAAVGVLEFFGRTLVVSVLAYWTVVLYLVFFVFIVNVFNAVPEDVGAAFAAGGAKKVGRCRVFSTLCTILRLFRSFSTWRVILTAAERRLVLVG
jgi:uncharacterized membrane protein YkvI